MKKVGLLPCMGTQRKIHTLRDKKLTETRTQTQNSR